MAETHQASILVYYKMESSAFSRYHLSLMAISFCPHLLIQDLPDQLSKAEILLKITFFEIQFT